MTEILRNLPTPSYVAIFNTVSSGVDMEGMAATAEQLMAEVQSIDGYLGAEFAGGPEFSIGLVFFETLEALDRWRHHPAHVAAKEHGRSTWLADWNIRICELQDSYGHA